MICLLGLFFKVVRGMMHVCFWQISHFVMSHADFEVVYSCGSFSCKAECRLQSAHVSLSAALNHVFLACILQVKVDVDGIFVGARASRAKNTASPAEVSRLLRATIAVEVVQSWLDDKTFEAAEVAEKFEKAICDVLKWTARPTKNLLQNAFQEAFKLTSSESMAISQAIINTITNARNTAKSVTSGVKTSPSIRRIISVLKGDGKLKVEDRSIRKSCSTPCLAKAEDASSSKKRKSSADDIMEISSAEFLSDCDSPAKPTQQRLKESRSSFGIHSPAKTSTWWIDWAECLVKRRQGHDVQVAVLEPGPDGFVLAQFEGATKFVTEMPNLFLKQHTGKQHTAGKSSAKVSKKPAAGVAILRKPAAASSAADVSAAPAAAAACQLVKIDEEACEASPEEKHLGSILKVCKTCASMQAVLRPSSFAE